NPHDIAWWGNWSERFVAETNPPSVVSGLPPNFETPAQLLARGKPRVQRSLNVLASRPSVARNTVVLFTSDHGEYGDSHGLRGKGAGMYEEAIRVPLIVSDPTGNLGGVPNTVRHQLSSSVDLAPLLLTVASGSNSWRLDPNYSHLATRADLARIVPDPSAAGRRY